MEDSKGWDFIQQKVMLRVIGPEEQPRENEVQIEVVNEPTIEANHNRQIEDVVEPSF